MYNTLQNGHASSPFLPSLPSFFSFFSLLAPTYSPSQYALLPFFFSLKMMKKRTRGWG